MTDKCQFCHGTKIEPGQPDCIWCDNTGLAHHVRIGSATFKFFKDSVTRGLGVMLVSTEGAEHVPHSDFFKADPAPSAEEEAAFRAYLAADPMATYWSTWQAARKGTQSQLAALREELAKYNDGFFQQVTDADLKKISDFVGDGDLPTQSFFMRPDAANLANMTMHMVREVQSMRVRLADAERRNSERDAQLSKATAFVERLCDSAGNQPSIATGYLRDILDALNPNPEAASHD